MFKPRNNTFFFSILETLSIGDCIYLCLQSAQRVLACALCCCSFNQALTWLLSLLTGVLFKCTLPPAYPLTWLFWCNTNYSLYTAFHLNYLNYSTSYAATVLLSPYTGYLLVQCPSLLLIGTCLWCHTHWFLLVSRYTCKQCYLVIAFDLGVPLTGSYSEFELMNGSMQLTT